MSLFFESTSLELRDQAVETIQSCMNDIGKLITANKLKLNKDKTELIVTSSQHRPKPQLDTLTFDLKMSSVLMLHAILGSPWMIRLTSRNRWHQSVSLPFII